MQLQGSQLRVTNHEAGVLFPPVYRITLRLPAQLCRLLTQHHASFTNWTTSSVIQHLVRAVPELAPFRCGGCKPPPAFPSIFATHPIRTFESTPAEPPFFTPSGDAAASAD
ncbi:hypothetical protein EON66_08535 [archaeon]|nr:MAG: hypothetical protein EON66_08535 [archaeon]